MPATTTPERPRQVTAVAWTIVVASVLVVVTVFDYVSGLRTLESREQIADLLSEPPGSDFGISVPTAIEGLRVLAFVAAACAAATAILGYQVLQRSTSARLTLSVLAVPLFFAGMPSAGLLAAIVVAAVVMLWMQPTRDWYAGRAVPAKPRTPSARPQQPGQQSSQQPGQPPAARQGEQPWSPPPAGPAGGFPPAGGAAPGPYGGDFGRPAPGPQAVVDHPYAGAPQTGPYARPPREERRPSSVVWACVLTWVFSLMTAGMMLVLAVALAVSGENLIDEAYTQSPQLADLPYSRGELTAGILVMAVALAAWALMAIALAALVFVGSGWARIALQISALGAALLMLLALWGAVFLVVPLAACVATITFLQRAETRMWCARRR